MLNCSLSSEQMMSFYKDFLESIALISAPTVIIDRSSIASRKTEYTWGNSMYLFIEFLFENQSSLLKRV